MAEQNTEQNKNPVQKANNKTEKKPVLPRVIAISSGKGGVGKSSITVNLGISLAKHGARVCVLDADTGLANANILLGLNPQFSLEHVLYGAKSIEEVMLDGPHGMKIIPGAHGISECVSLHPRQQLRLTRELARIENDFDFLLVDTAAGISSTTLDFVSAAQHALIVITPEPTSLTDAFSLIKLLKRRSSRLHYHVVVNMCASASQAKEVYHRFCSAIEKYIGVESHYLGFILRDESMRAAVVLQNPVAMFPDDDPSCRSFLRLADTLENATSALSSNASFSAYWHRQFRRQRSGADEQADNNASVPVNAVEQAAQTREQDYISELRSRILLLIEQEETDKELVKKLLQDASDAFVKNHNMVAVDVLGLVDFLAQSPERNDLLLRDIHDRVKHWGSVNVEPSVDELMGDDREPLVVEVLDQPVDIVHNGDKTPPVVEVDNEDIEHLDAFKKARDAVEAAQQEPLPTETSLNLEPDDEHRVPTLLDSTGLNGTGLDRTTELDSTGENTVDVITADAAPIHHYDVERFGSQEGLLELLRRRPASDKPLSELLENWL